MHHDPCMRTSILVHQQSWRQCTAEQKGGEQTNGGHLEVRQVAASAGVVHQLAARPLRAQQHLRHRSSRSQ